MKKLLTLIAALCAGAVCLAADPPSTRHTVRAGWGDMLFETLAFHPSAPGAFDPDVLPADYRSTGTFDHGYTGHIFVDYMYSLNSVTSVGIQTDLEGIFWKEGTRDRNRQLIGEAKNVRNWDLTLLPTVRFTYFRSDWVNMYSGVSVGALIAFDNLGQAELAPAFNLNFFGIKVGKGHWGGFAELGMLNALTGANSIYMAGSRLISVGASYTW